MSEVIGEAWSKEVESRMKKYYEEKNQKLVTLIESMKHAKEKLEIDYIIDTPEYNYFTKTFDEIINEAEKMLSKVEE